MQLSPFARFEAGAEDRLPQRTGARAFAGLPRLDGSESLPLRFSTLSPDLR